MGKIRALKENDIDTFDPENIKSTLAEESSFVVLYPKYREIYLKEVEKHISLILQKHKIDFILDVSLNQMTVKTMKSTKDPYSIIKARDFIKLLSRSVPFPAAAQILDEGFACDIIKISGMAKNEEIFAKRRSRIHGPDGKTLRAIEILTKCHITVHGGTVSVIGPYQGLREAREIVTDCMRNTHPIYRIKTLMVKRELEMDERMKHESWDRFLPKFKKTHEKRKAKTIVDRKPYTPFPPPIQPRKVDLEMETGEYFLKREKKPAKRDMSKSRESIEPGRKKRSRR